jgi:hypothetical protein
LRIPAAWLGTLVQTDWKDLPRHNWKKGKTLANGQISRIGLAIQLAVPKFTVSAIHQSTKFAELPALSARPSASYLGWST